MSSRFLMYPLLASLLGCAGAAYAIESDTARAKFKALDDDLQKNPLDFETSFDAVSGGNGLYRGKGHFIVRQPNSLRADVTLGGSKYLVVSDGKTLTIYNPQQRKYASVSSPPSLAAAFGFFTGELGIDSQVIAFMDVVHAAVAAGPDTTVKAQGSESVDGKSCDKFTVSVARGDDTWQAWLQKSNTPLLCKLIYHSVDGPSQTNTFHWNPVPQLTPATFTFSPPAGTKKVDVGDLNMVSP